MSSSSRGGLGSGSGSGEARRRRVDYVAELGQARAMQRVQDWLDNHEGRPLSFSDIPGSNDLPPGELPPAGKWSLDIDTGCWLLHSGVSSGGVGNTSGRYGVAKMLTNAELTMREAGLDVGRNPGINFQWHVVAYLAHTGRNIEQTASHLCGRSVCFNPTHIVDESQADNLSRRPCLGEIWCLKHEKIVLDLCVHTPKCIHPVVRNEERLQPNCCTSRSPSPGPDVFAPASDYSLSSPHRSTSSPRSPESPPSQQPPSSPPHQLPAEPLSSERVVSSPPAVPQQSGSGSNSTIEANVHRVPVRLQPRRREEAQRAVQAFYQRDPTTVPGLSDLRRDIRLHSATPDSPVLRTLVELVDEAEIEVIDLTGAD